ncbi:MAG: hypothetical protein AAB480_04335 [Patescibacteria group bacterium]
MLRDAVAEQKKRGWPEDWRAAVSKLAVKDTQHSWKGMSAFISTLDPYEWDSLDFPSPAKYLTPPSARRKSRQDIVPADKPKDTAEGQRVKQRILERKDAWMPVLVAEAERLNGVGTYVTLNKIAGGTYKQLKMSPNAVYEFIRVHCREKDNLIRLKILNADGTPVVRQKRVKVRKTPSPPLQPNGKGKGVVLSEKDKQLLSGIDQRYESALAALKPQKRTRKNLAVALGFGEGKVDFVDAYLFQHREFAAKLADGNEALSTGYLKKTG